MVTDFNKIYSLEIDIKNLETTYNSKAIYANTDLNTSVMLIKLSLDGKGLDVTDKIVNAYIKTGIDGNITMQKCEILEATEGIVGLDFKNSALKVGINTFFIEIKSENDEVINTPLINYKVVELFDVSDSIEGENDVKVLNQLITDIDVARVSIERNKEEIESIKASMEVINGEIISIKSEMETEIKSLETSIEKNKEDINTIVEESISEINRNIGVIDTEIDSINSSIDEMKQEISEEINQKLSVVSEATEDNKAEIDNTKTSLTETNRNIDSINSSIETINTEIDSINGSIVTINDDIEGLEASINKTKEDIDNIINESISEVNQSIDNIEQEIITTKDSIEENKEEINTLKTSLEEIGSKVITIDDSTLDENSTWSSAKIEDFTLINDEVVWSEVSGEDLAIDYTKEGHLREVEIFGNTIQGFADCVSHQQIVDSINATGFNTATLNSDGTFTVTGAGTAPSTTNWAEVDKEGFIELKPNTKYSCCIWREDNGTFPYIYYTLYEEEGIKSCTGSTSSTFTTGASGKFLIHPASAQGGRLKIRIVEGDYSLKDYPYDYNVAHIEHLGELYVNDEGEPILDELDREQYKIDIESYNNTLLTNWDDYDIVAGRCWEGVIETGYVEEAIKNDTGFTFKITGSSIRGAVLQGIKGQGVGKYTVEFDVNTYGGANKCTMYANINTFKNGVFVEQANTNTLTTVKGTRHTKDFNLTKDFDEMWLSIGASSPAHNGKHGVENINIYKGEYSNSGVFKYQKETILLPCQLMKVGNFSDRLYWDKEKNKYIVEKKVNKTNIPSTSKFSRRQDNGICVTYSTGLISGAQQATANVINYVNNLTKVGASNSKNNEGCMSSWVWNAIGFSVLKSRLKEDSINGFVELITPNGVDVFYEMKNYQLIETNIIKKLVIDSNKHKTNLCVSGGINGSIKAKVPLNGGQAIFSLNSKNEELEKINQEQDSLINTTMLATDEMLMMLEPLIAKTIGLNSNSENHITKMYVAMVQRGLKNIEDVPSIYREQVKELLE